MGVPEQLRFTALASLAALMISGCYVDAYAVVAKEGLASDESGDTEGTEGAEGQDTTGQSTTGQDTEGPILDIPGGDEGGTPLTAAACRPDEFLDAPLPCDAEPPTANIDPTVAWQWFGQDDETSVLVTPLVANLSDDNGSGSVDLCDRPDIVVIAVALPEGNTPLPPGHVYVLDGDTGNVNARFEHPVDAATNPVIADLDGDEVPEVIATTGELDNLRAIAFDTSGEVLWESAPWSGSAGGLAVADLDLDGSPEIITPGHVLTAEGELAWSPDDPPEGLSLPVPVDLDLDGDLELIFGRSVYDHAGNLVFSIPGDQNIAVAAVANFDDDEYPEIFIQTKQYQVYDHDGTMKSNCGAGAKARPATLADIDGDGTVEILGQRNKKFRAVRADANCTVVAEISVDKDADASGTTFDLDADGSPETMVVANGEITFLDAQWNELASLPEPARASALTVPIVVDADNDGAAEILVVGSQQRGVSESGPLPAVELIQNADDRFAPTRRIWNQHAYYVTNIREDGHVPDAQEPHWLAGSNSFRTNLEPSYEGELCQEQLPHEP